MEKVTFKKSDEVRKKAEQLFTEQKRRIALLIPSADIQHVGGTAIPGLLTKGDLDINVRVSKDVFPGAVENLRKLYAVNQAENWTNTFASFKDDASFALPLGIQVTVAGSAEDHFVKHRDALLNDLTLFEKFNDLKRKFSGKDMESYRDAKAEFLKGIDGTSNLTSKRPEPPAMEKFKLFLKIAKELNKKLEITPVLYGSLGLSVLLRAPIQVNDIDILVPERFVASEWGNLCELMKGFNFEVKDEKEHEFERGNETVAFASTNALSDVKLTVGDLGEKTIDGATFKELTPEQYLLVYKYTLTDGYRLTKHSDQEKIALIEEHLLTRDGEGV